MAVPATTIELLDTETHPYHAEVDGFWRSLSYVGDVRRAYIQRLGIVYGFEVAFEVACTRAPGLDGWYPRRSSRMEAIVHDLFALGLRCSEVSKLPPSSKIAPLDGAIEACGWLYVMERATLSQHEARYALAVRAGEITEAFAYFDACQDSCNARWDELGRFLQRTVPDVGRDRLFKAAHRGFHSLIEWYRSCFISAALGR